MKKRKFPWIKSTTIVTTSSFRINCRPLRPTRTSVLNSHATWLKASTKTTWRPSRKTRISKITWFSLVWGRRSPKMVSVKVSSSTTQNSTIFTWEVSKWSVKRNLWICLWGTVSTSVLSVTFLCSIWKESTPRSPFQLLLKKSRRSRMLNTLTRLTPLWNLRKSWILRLPLILNSVK